MKKILLLLSLAVLLGACNDTETPAPESPFARAESHVRSLIEKFGDYDPAEVESMIAGKMLTLSVRLEYNESRTEVIGVPYAFGESDEGVQADRYLLRRDGSCTRYYWTDGGWLRAEGSWSLDNEARTLQLMDDIVEIVALGPYSIIWDKETCEIPGSKPRSLMDNYIIEPIDPNFPDPRQDTVYEPIDVLLVTRGQEITDIFGYENPPKSYSIEPNSDNYEIIISVIFDSNTPFEINQYGTNIYLWFEMLTGEMILFPKVMNTLYYHLPRLYPSYYPGYDDDDYRMPVYICFPDIGAYDIVAKVYDPRTQKYFISPKFRLEFGTIDNDNIILLN